MRIVKSSLNVSNDVDSFVYYDYAGNKPLEAISVTNYPKRNIDSIKARVAVHFMNGMHVVPVINGDFHDHNSNGVTPGGKNNPNLNGYFTMALFTPTFIYYVVTDMAVIYPSGGIVYGNGVMHLSASYQVTNSFNVVRYFIFRCPLIEDHEKISVEVSHNDDFMDYRHWGVGNGVLVISDRSLAVVKVLDRILPFSSRGGAFSTAYCISVGVYTKTSIFWSSIFLLYLLREIIYSFIFLRCKMIYLFPNGYLRTIFYVLITYFKF